MYHITKVEVLSWLENMRQIRKKTGEMIAFLEHMMQMQQDSALREVSYNPDAYLEDDWDAKFERIHRAIFEYDPYKYSGGEHSVGESSDSILVVVQETYKSEKGGYKQ